MLPEILLGLFFFFTVLDLIGFFCQYFDWTASLQLPFCRLIKVSWRPIWILWGFFFWKILQVSKFVFIGGFHWKAQHNENSVGLGIKCLMVYFISLETNCLVGFHLTVRFGAASVLHWSKQFQCSFQTLLNESILILIWLNQIRTV